MKKTCLNLFLFLLSSFAQLHAIECGQYELKGTVKKINDQFKIVVNEKSNSEIILSTPPLMEVKLVAYINRPMVSTVVIDHKTKGNSAMIKEIKSITLGKSDPMAQADNTSLNLISKLECAR